MEPMTETILACADFLSVCKSLENKTGRCIVLGIDCHNCGTAEPGFCRIGMVITVLAILLPPPMMQLPSQFYFFFHAPPYFFV